MGIESRLAIFITAIFVLAIIGSYVFPRWSKKVRPKSPTVASMLDALGSLSVYIARSIKPTIDKAKADGEFTPALAEAAKTKLIEDLTTIGAPLIEGVKAAGSAALVSPAAIAVLAEASVEVAKTPAPPVTLPTPAPVPPAPGGNPGFVLRETLAWPTLIGLAIGCVAMLLALGHAGCSGRQYTPPENALLAIHSTAHGVHLTDALVATQCGVASPAPACSTFVVSYALARTNLILAETLANDWRAHPSATAACRVVVVLRSTQEQVTNVRGALDALHVPQPAEIVQGMGLIGLIVAGSANCPASSGGL